MKEFYVYTLTDPRDQSVFYVGKGCGRRMYAHVKEARKGVQSMKCARIREILAAGLDVDVRPVQFFLNEQAAYDHERLLIAEYGDALTNGNKGGGFARYEGEPEAVVLERWWCAVNERPQTRRDIAALRQHLRRIDAWRTHPRFAGFTFPGIPNGHALAMACVEQVEELVLEHDQAMSVKWMA